jgi:hypothetical protein
MSEKMIFCLGEGKYVSSGIGYQQNLMIFNKKVSEEVYNQTIKYIRAKDFKLPVAKWIEYKDLNKDEQTTTAKQLNGLLKTLSYQNAWKEMWATFSKEDKNFFKTIPNFDAELFENITGIKFEDNSQKTELLKKAQELIDKAEELKNEAEKL